ncbi:MAG: PepSY domain-containing protein [Actinomycetaceae bacterium]|nr:PepSY domain-containing protein [Actinomycetaceae bacterium]
MKKNKFAFALFVPLLLVPACSSDDAGSSSSAPASSSPAVSATASSAPSTSQPASPEAGGPFADTASGIEAVRAAQDAGGGTVLELDREDSDRLWEVEVLEGTQKVTYYVSEDGTVTEHKRKDADAKDVNRVAGVIPAADAIKTALDALGEAFLDECELDDNDGVLVWEMDFDDASGHDFAKVEVNAKTGEVTKKELK